MSKRILALCAALLLCALCATALAAGNATIAVNGQDGFDEYIQNMFIWDGRLLLSSWNRMFTWSPETRQLTEVQGYDELRTDYTAEEDGTSTVTLGESTVELEEGESLSLYGQIVVYRGRLYRIAAIYDEEGQTGSMLVELIIDEDGTPSFGRVIDLGDALLYDNGDGYVYAMDLQNPCEQSGFIYALTYGENGREMIMLDVENQSVDPLALDTDLEIDSMSSFGEGKLLLVGSDYTGDALATRLMLYDVQSEELTVLGDVPSSGGWNGPAGLCYDEARGMLYYAQGGSVWRCTIGQEGIGEPEEFGDMPLEAYSDAQAVLLGDLYIISSYDGVVGRDVTAQKLPEQRLRIANSNYAQAIKKAYYPFTDAHPEFAVTITDGMNTDSVVQNMMNRSDEVDIFVMSSQDDAFSAMMARGFMAELGESAVLSAAVEAMYPPIRENVMKDGELYAVPMDVWANGMSVNTELLTQKLGVAEEELPDSWPGLLALLANLADGRMQEVPEISLLDPGYTRSDARMVLFSNMLNDYFLWMDMDPANLDRSSEVLLALCEAFETIDWEGFGLPEELEEDSWSWDEENILLTNTGLQMETYGDSMDRIVPLSMAQGEAGYIGLTMTVAFVNPFSRNREAAIEYLETACAMIEPTISMQMSPKDNAPIENKYYEESIKSIRESIGQLEQSIGETEDEELRGELQQNLEDMQTYAEEFEQTGRWSVTQENIDRYQQLAQYFAVRRATLWSTDSNAQIMQYLDGAITAQQFVSELGETLRMKRLEGM